jgi:hypothetical protein
MQYDLPSTSTGVSLEEKALVLPIDQAKLSPVAIEDVRPTNFAEFVYKNVGAFTDQLV